MKSKTKDIIQYSSAVAVLMCAMGLSIASFIVSMGQIHETVLWFFAQALLYAGSVFGISIYVNDKLNRFRLEMSGEIKKDEDDSK